jgi:uncharacterized protein YjeT (DUF2065 family)
MKLLILVIGMVMIVEGLPYAAAPEKMQEWMVRLSEIEPKLLRSLGLCSLCTGLLICWIVQKTQFFS